MGHEVVGEPGFDGVGCRHVRTGQPEVAAEVVGRISQQPGAADVREQADADFRHADAGVVGDDAV